MNAYLLVRDEPHYRSDAFKAGLRACGFNVVRDFPSLKDERGNVLVIWNRYGFYNDAASRMANAGGTVLIAENGSIGKDAQGIQFYQLVRDYHAGFGTWHVGEEDRWAKLNIPLLPWRDPAAGKYVLVCEQRGIGVAPVASPHGFAEAVGRELQAAGVPFRIRLHPESPAGRAAQQRPLQADLEEARCVVVWTSTVGVRALTLGIPVIFRAARWIAEGAAVRSLVAASNTDLLCRSDEARLTALRRLAWSQWSVEELATGTPFRSLCM